MTPPSEPAPDQSSLGGRLGAASQVESDGILDLFIDWVGDLGFELFPAQEEALLEIFADRHVILNTPTGSGKSLVAAGLHFKALAEGKRSYYTSPIKALASEKFFDLCRDFGPENVGMLTGDASINPDAPLICCTAEVLSNLAIRYGDALDADTVVMDEFHYYSDPERGVAWQIPLITLPHAQFLLMSATLGNPAPIAERLERFSSRKVATVTSVERPVPLEFEYSERVIQETIERLAQGGQAPIYVVNFTQRECAELAGALTSLKLTDKEQKQSIRDAIGDFSFDTTYGKEMRRFLSFGIGVHHAGLLPKYRLLVEQLAQQGLLRVICGTDTLGVGVNIPIRTVLFRKLCKFDGKEMTILSVRDFKQIAGRAGRKGFDDIGNVVCQAPEHVVENLKQERKAKGKKGGKPKKTPRKQPPKFGYLHWDEQTFRRLIERPPETLVSQFKVSHSMLLGLIQRDGDENDPERGNFASLRELIGNCHESPQRRLELISESANLTRALHRAGIVKMVRDTESGYRWVVVDETLQIDFALHQSLSLFLVEALESLDPESEDFAAVVLSLAESILEDPMLILRRQVDKAKDDLIARLKAEGVDYDERMARLEEVTHPKPNAESIYQLFNAFRERNPWAFQDSVRPKGIGTEIWETYADFNDYVRSYGIQRSEGLLLRYLSQLFKVLSQTVPVEIKTEEVWEMLGFFRALLSRVDNSLIREWESMLHPETGTRRIAGTERGDQALEDFELLRSPKAFRARVRAELHQLVRALARRDWEEAALCVWHPDGGAPAGGGAPADDEACLVWTAERFESALERFFESYEEIVFDPQARLAHHTHIEQQDAGRFEVTHTLLDPEEDNFWHLEGVVLLDLDARASTAAELGLDRPLLRLRSISD